MKKRITGFRGRILVALIAAGAASVTAPIFANIETEALAPVARHEKIGQLVTEFIQKSHYRHASVDDELSSKVLDRYIESLDSNRMYLLESDVQAFEQYRFELDDANMANRDGYDFRLNAKGSKQDLYVFSVTVEKLPAAAEVAVEEEQESAEVVPADAGDAGG